MKQQGLILAISILALIGMSGTAFGGETSLAGYVTYWDGGENGGNEGVGGGARLRKKFLGFFAADIRAGYVDFSDLDTSVIPLEATVMVGIPFLIEPYVGLGAGYYILDTAMPDLDSGAGGYGVVGLQLNLWVVGAMAEVRYNESETDLMDGLSANLGLMVKW